jgi:FKBP-type peptidyl-prolyl cis-trans isomerase FklB
MKKELFLRSGVAVTQLCLVMVSSCAIAQSTGANPAASVQVAPSYPDKKSNTSYAIGVTTARNLIRDGVEIDPAIVLKGMTDAFAGKTTLLTDAEIKSIMNGLVSDMRQRFVANRKNVEDGNFKRGDDFRAAFARQPGVKVMPDGVLIKELEAGSGAIPGKNDTVTVSYKGTLVDGKEFDSTPDGQSTSFQVSKLIPGWREALTLMPVGARWKIVVPSQLAYGDRGIGTDVGPNETLVFDVKLLKVTKAD